MNGELDPDTPLPAKEPLALLLETVQVLVVLARLLVKTNPEVEPEHRLTAGAETVGIAFTVMELVA